MNKNDLGFTLYNVNKEPILQVDAIVVHGVDATRKTDLEMHARPLLNGWGNCRITKIRDDVIRIVADHSYLFEKREGSVVYSQDGKGEQKLDDRSAEVILCIMEQVNEELKPGRRVPSRKKA